LPFDPPRSLCFAPDDYKAVAEAGIYFATDQANLDAAAKADLDMVAAGSDEGVD
jgi:hypothetical protein